MKFLRKAAIALALSVAAVTVTPQVASAAGGGVQLSYQNTDYLVKMYVNTGPNQWSYQFLGGETLRWNVAHGTRLEFWAAGANPGVKVHSQSFNGGDLRLVCTGRVFVGSRKPNAVCRPA